MTHNEYIRSQLLPCPFCGGSAYAEIRRGFICGQPQKIALAYCERCGAKTTNVPREYGGREAIQKAISLWNERTI